MRQTADLGKGIVELPLHVLCLTAHIFYLSLQVLLFIDKLLVLRAEMVGAFLDVMLLCFQMRDSLLVEAQSCGDGPQFVKGHLRTAAVSLLEKLDVPHDGAKVAAGIVETADHAEKQQQQQKADNLQYAFQQNLVIVASGEQHSQRMGLCISAGCQKRLGKPYKGVFGSAVGGESLPNALFRQYLIRHEAEAVGGIGDQAFGNIQSCRTVRQETGKAADTGGLDMVGEEIALIDGKAAESIHRAVRAHHGHGEQNRPFRGVGQGQQRRCPAVIVNGCRRCIQVLGEAGELGYIKLLGPFSVGHHMMPPPDVSHTTIEQKVTGHAGRVAPLDVQTAEVAASSDSVSFAETLLNIIPKNPIGALANGEMLQVIVFALIVGVILAKLQDKTQLVTNFFQQGNDIMMEMTMMVMGLAPIGVFCLIAKTFAGLGFSAMVPMFKYMGAVLLALVIQCCGVYQILLALLTRLNPLRFLKKFAPVMGFAFSTATSNATIPMNIDTLEEKIGVNRRISSFTIPLGATINMDGTSIMQGVAVVFVAQAFGIQLSPADYLTVIATATLASIGTAGVPSVGLVTLAMVFDSVGLPVAGIGLIMGIDRILDMARTAVNITGDAVCTTIVAHQDGALDKSVFNKN